MSFNQYIPVCTLYVLVHTSMYFFHQTVSLRRQRLDSNRASTLCLTSRQELSRQSVGLASQDHSDTHDSNAGRGPASKRLQDYASARPARPARQRRTRWIQQRLHRRRSYKLHIGCFSTRLETSCGGISGGPKPAGLQATPWRLR